MRGLVITTEGEAYIKKFKEPYWKTLGEEVGGYIEQVHPLLAKQVGLFEDKHMFVVNEEGLLIGLKENTIGSFLYGAPIVGNIVIFNKTYKYGGDMDWVDIDNECVDRIKTTFRLEKIDERT